MSSYFSPKIIISAHHSNIHSLHIISCNRLREKQQKLKMFFSTIFDLKIFPLRFERCQNLILIYTPTNNQKRAMEQNWEFCDQSKSFSIQFEIIFFSTSIQRDYIYYIYLVYVFQRKNLQINWALPTWCPYILFYYSLIVKCAVEPHLFECMGRTRIRRRKMTKRNFFSCQFKNGWILFKTITLITVMLYHKQSANIKNDNLCANVKE